MLIDKKADRETNGTEYITKNCQGNKRRCRDVQRIHVGLVFQLLTRADSDVTQAVRSHGPNGQHDSTSCM